MRAKFLILVLLVSLLAACAPKEEMPTALLPAGKAFAEGKEIFFVHTEASDEGVAKLLSDMMTSPVLYVPALANTPAEILANVYVFDNGLEGMGPFGFQAMCLITLLAPLVIHRCAVSMW